eukprot:TRINITY_DN7115_c0_g2_i1.p1 TRINITY_DN7115_c0_g2~~TRINITY_DN7115_c0_g2_i1.p1  ORF type:complete len:102 (-),score=4.51 TRINITY_DN7115_c0_g2_i1:123-428(-)
MITRPNLAEQLRDYQLRSSYQWKSLSFFASTSSISSRAEATQAAFLCAVFVGLWIGALAATYSRRIWIGTILVMLAVAMLLCLRFIRQRRTFRRKQRGILP